MTLVLDSLRNTEATEAKKSSWVYYRLFFRGEIKIDDRYEERERKIHIEIYIKYTLDKLLQIIL